MGLFRTVAAAVLPLITDNRCAAAKRRFGPTAVITRAKQSNILARSLTPAFSIRAAQPARVPDRDMFHRHIWRGLNKSEHSDIVPNAPGQQLLQVHCRALTERISILRYPGIAGLSP